MNHQIKILFLCPYPYDEVASQRFRFEQYYDILRTHNLQFRYKSFYSGWVYKILYRERMFFLKFIGIFYGFIKRLLHLFYCISPDYIFIHRELTPLGPPFFEWIIARIFRKKIIYDFDDAIWVPNTSEENKIISGLKWHKKFNSICTWSYKINCCNNYLAENAKKYNRRVNIIPTTLDTQKYDLILKNNYSDNVIIGWTGTHTTLPYLLPIIDLIKKVITDNPTVSFRVICNKKPEWRFPGLEFLSWNKETEVDDLSGIDIGIMPIPDTNWSRGKCGFKILQYFSLGIPAVASSVGVNNDIIIHGKNGFLCTNEREWIAHINQLVQSFELRKQMGLNGRKTVQDHYSLEVNTKYFLALFE